PARRRVLHHRAARATAAGGAGRGAGSAERPPGRPQSPGREARPGQLLFLPPSSPDGTPIAQAFSTITAILRRRGARTLEARWQALRVAVEASPPHDALAGVAHPGYALSAAAPCKV